MEKALICPICGRPFKTILPNKKYCGPACADVGRRQLRSIWETENPGYNATYMRNYRTAKKKERNITV